MVIEIKCMKDIKALSGKSDIPDKLIEYITIDLKTIKEWSDYDNEYSIDTYNTDYTGNGEIVILDGTETVKELEEGIGLTGGLDRTIPEAVNLCNFNGVTWRRIVVVYNDSYANIIWIPNYDGLDSYAV